MAQTTRELVTRFFADLNAGAPDEALFTPDWVVWTLSTRAEESGRSDLEANRILLSLFPEGLAYRVDTLLVAGDRAAARVTAQGTLTNGEEYLNHYVFLFETRDGLIARIEEFFDPKLVEEQLMPLFIEALNGKPG